MKIRIFVGFIFLFLWTNSVFAEKSKSNLNRCEANGDKTEVFIRTTDQGFQINNQLTSRSLNTKSHSSYAGD
jgi:hypothetical protein